MKKLNKLLIAGAAVVVGITLGALLISQPGNEYIDEQEVRAVVTDRYAGDIDSVSMSDDEQFYIVNLKDGDYRYEIKVNRDDSSVENIVTEKLAQQEEDKATKEAKEKSSEEPAEKDKSTEKKKDSEKDKKAKEKAETKEKEKKVKEGANTPITEDEAKQIARNEVGGEFVHLTLNQETHTKQYQIIQLVEDDEEGALVTVDAIGGEVLKVLWFQADFNNIADIEAFAKQLQDYNTQYQNNHYIEFDDEGDSDSDDDSDDDSDGDDD